MDGIVYIVALTHLEAKNYAEAEKLAPFQWRYIYESVQLRGLHNADIRAIGRWRQLQDSDELSWAIYYHSRREKK